MKLLVKKEGELLNYLYENIDMPKKKIKQYLTHGSIFVNNSKITQYNYKVFPGMNITIDTKKKNIFKTVRLEGNNPGNKSYPN